MKLRLNKQTLSQMPTQVREIVTEWKSRYNKAFITVENTDGFYPGEDAKVSMINLLTDKQQTERVAGDFAGYTKLSPTAKVPLAQGMVAVVTGFFCGHPYLNIYQGGVAQIASVHSDSADERAQVQENISAEEYRMASALR